MQVTPMPTRRAEQEERVSRAGGPHRAPGPLRCSVTEAAPLLGVSVYMVRALIRQRQLPYHRIGRRIVLDRQDLEQFLLAHRVEARERQVDPRRWPPSARTRSASRRPLESR